MSLCQVLGLAGHVGAASAAVFELLGTDSRFGVDKEGMWSLDPDVVPLGALDSNWVRICLLRPLPFSLSRVLGS